MEVSGLAIQAAGDIWRSASTSTNVERDWPAEDDLRSTGSGVIMGLFAQWQAAALRTAALHTVRIRRQLDGLRGAWPDNPDTRARLALDVARDLRAFKEKPGNGFDLQPRFINEGIYLLAFDDRWPVRYDREWHRTYTGEAALFLFEETKSGAMNAISVGEPIPWSTHPGQRSTRNRGTPDVNNDGRKDIAYAVDRVAYEYRIVPNSRNRYNTTAHRVPVHRDAYAPFGALNDDDLDLYPGTAVQLHAGKDGYPTSIGCSTAPPADYDRLCEWLDNLRKQTGDRTFTYGFVQR